MLQELCKQRLDWDSTIPDSNLKQWQTWRQKLQELENIEIERCLNQNQSNTAKHELHVFCDSSEKAYCAVAYLRVVTEKEVRCNLVMSKSRVTPINKRITIPRLELASCKLGVELAKIIEREMDLELDIHYWTDSMSALRYVSNDSARFHTFVANRVHFIREGSNVKQWRYIQSELNPADMGTRGVNPDDVSNVKKWINGPSFLSDHDDEWKITKQKVLCLSGDDPEVRRHVHSAATPYNDFERNFLNRFSTFSRLRRITAWVLIFYKNVCKRVQERKQMEQEASENRGKLMNGISHLSLSKQELEDAENCIVKSVQQAYFKEDVILVSEGKPVKRNSKLRKLDPMMTNGILRIGGRLSRSDLAYDTKHPIIMPKESHVSLLLLEHAHKSTGHLGRNAMIANSRENYWIIGAAGLSKRITGKCVTCRKYRAKTLDQKMADLPKDRVSMDEKAFRSIAIDYCGPIKIKYGHRKTVNRWIMVAVCMKSRAVHLELVSSLDASSCINAIRRLMGRRGHVSIIWSDNGTAFVGAKGELKAEFQKLIDSKIIERCAEMNIEWNFNPPAASHFGGLFERMIREVRKIMYGLLKEQTIRLDDEGFHTLLCEIESILNNRPLTQLSSDQNDLSFLTPNHILCLNAPSTCPTGIFDKNDTYVKRRWKQIQYLSDIFWQRWSKEYLTSLQERQKWVEPKRNVKIGDVVLIVDNSPRNSWNLGRVLDVISDKKGLVRVVKIKTQTTILNRPIHKLCMILENDNEQ